MESRDKISNSAFSRDKEWAMFEKAENQAKKWAQANNVTIHYTFFLDHKRGPSEVFVFYKTDEEVARYEENGVTEKIKSFFFSIFEGYKKEGITIIIDSDENVQNNYEGSYFFRFR
jgi:hypothetical protein